MKIIGFGELSYYLLFPLFTPILSSLFITISQSLITDSNSDDTIQNHPFILTFFYFLSQTMAGILEVISIQLRKRKIIKTEGTTIVYPPRFYVGGIQEEKKSHSWKLFLIILGLSLCEANGLFCSLFMFVSHQDVIFSQLLTLKMIFSGLLSIPILHYKLFKHQVVAIGLFMAGISIIAFKTFEYTEGLYVGIIFICLVMWAFQTVTIKWIMTKFFISQFKFLFYHGFIGMTIFFVALIFTPYISCTQGKLCPSGVVEPTWETLSWILGSKLILNVLGLIIISCIYNIFLITTIKLFTPTHNDASESLGSLISWIYFDFIENNKTVEFILSCQIVGYSLMIIACLMYNEIIIVYMCNLGYYTKKEIAKRSQEECKLADTDINLAEINHGELLN